MIDSVHNYEKFCCVMTFGADLDGNLARKMYVSNIGANHTHH